MMEAVKHQTAGADDPRIVFRSATDFPAEYALAYSGNDYAPRIEHGDFMVFATGDEPTRGDTVVVWLRADKMKSTEAQPGIFTFLMGQPDIHLPFDDRPEFAVKPVFILLQANGAQVAVHASRLLAVHKLARIEKATRQEGGEA